MAERHRRIKAAAERIAVFSNRYRDPEGPQFEGSQEDYLLELAETVHDAMERESPSVSREAADKLKAESAQLRAKLERYEGALRELLKWAEEARGHYGIEECAGPGQPATEWDAVQDGLQKATCVARAALEEDAG